MELPGGSVEKGENLESAAAREVFEETGLIIKSEDLEYITYFEFKNVETGKHKCKFAFSTVISGEILISKEHTAFRWVSKDQVKDMKLQSKYQKYEMWDDHYKIVMAE